MDSETTKDAVVLSEPAGDSEKHTDDLSERSSSAAADQIDPEKQAASVEETKETKNINIVDWDGPDDPANPRNWTKTTRILQVVLVSVVTLIAQLATTMYAPGAPALAKEFNVTSSVVVSLTVTMYLLGFCVGPLLIAPLSEIYGRMPIYHVCNGVFIAFTLGCALSTNVGMFLPFRFFAGCAGAAPLTNGGGTIADVIPQDQRGAAMAIFLLGPLIGPIAGPIIGGFMTQAIGWRWAFWLLLIMMGLVTILCLVFMRETYETVLLGRKAARLRKQTGNTALIARTDKGLTPNQLLKLSLLRPLKLMVLSPMVTSLSIFAGVAFGLVFLQITTFPLVFEEQYGFGTGTSGLAYLGLGFGMLFGTLIYGKNSDKLLKALAKGGELKPEYRLPFMVYTAPLLPAGFFWYGWTADKHVHWIVPILGTFLVGVGALFIVMPAQSYLVDAFGPYAASAVAAFTVIRCLAGAFLPLAGPPLYAKLGLGWGNSLLAFLALALIPIPLLFYMYGERLRKRSTLKL